MATPATPEDPNNPASFGDALEAAFSGIEAADNPGADPTVTPDPVTPPVVPVVVPADKTPPVVTAPKVPSVSKKTTPPVAAAPAEDNDDALKGMDEKAGAKFKEIRTEKKAAEARAVAAEARIAELEQKVAAVKPEELEDLRKRTTEYEAELSVTRVEATREFRDSIVAPTAAILDAAKVLAARYKADESQMLAALQEADPDKQSDLLTEVGATFSDRDRSRLYRMGDDLLTLNQRKTLILSNAKDSLARIESKRGEQVTALEAQQKAEYGQALDHVWGTLKGQSDFFNVDAEGVDPDHAKAITAATTLARGVDFDTLPPSGKAFAAYAGAQFPYLMQVIGGLQDQLAARDTELAGFKGTQPEAGSGGSGAEGAPESDPNMSFEDAIEKRFATI